MSKKIAIIGAGISGLSAGCYARMNGYEVEIYEAHSQPGGLCTAWQRGDYTFDGCIHWLTDSRPGGTFYQVWQELGAIQDRQFFDHDIFASYTGRDGRTLNFYTDVDRLQDHITSLAPGDSAAIEKLCRLIRRFSRFRMPLGKPPELMNAWDSVRMMARFLPYMKDVMTINATTLADIGAWFKDPLLSAGLTNALLDASMPAIGFVFTLAIMHNRAAGYPMGGSLEFSRAIEQRLLSLGGRITYNARVDKILEKDGRATGLRLAKGNTIDADYVISACDMHATLFDMLDGSRVDPLHKELLDTGKAYPPAVLVSFGVNMDFPQPFSCMGQNFALEQPLDIAGRRQTTFNVISYKYDPSLAPAGKTVVKSFITTDWAYWQRFLKHPAAYHEEKIKIAAVCRGQIDRLFPGFAAAVEKTDVATPLTFARYTGNREGRYMTWILSNDFQRRHRFIPKTVPGLANFYLASMWTNAPGGLPGAAQVGRQVIQLICREDRQRFVTSIP